MESLDNKKTHTEAFSEEFIENVLDKLNFDRSAGRMIRRKETSIDAEGWVTDDNKDYAVLVKFVEDLPVLVMRVENSSIYSVKANKDDVAEKGWGPSVLKMLLSLEKQKPSRIG